MLVVKSFNKMSLFAFIVGVINAFLPMELINIWFFPKRVDRDESLNYYEAEVNLKTDYSRANPAIASISNKKFIYKYQH